MDFNERLDFIRYLENLAKSAGTKRIAAKKATASRIKASAEHMAEAAAFEVSTLSQYISALAADAAMDAPDPDQYDSEHLADSTVEQSSRLVDLVTQLPEIVDEKQANLIFDETTKLEKIAMQTSYSADRNRDEIRSAVDSLRSAVEVLVVNAKIKIDEQAGEPPSQLIEVLNEISIQLINHLKNGSKQLHNLSPRVFEKLIAEILTSFGWEVNLTPTTRDGGYDIFAITKDIQAGVRTSWIIECKKYSQQRKVGVDIVRSLYGLKLDNRIANAMLATTSHFSREAQKYKKSRYDLELKDYESIIDWVNTYRPNPNGKLYIKNNQLVLL